jgi:hypothetical protein
MFNKGEASLREKGSYLFSFDSELHALAGRVGFHEFTMFFYTVSLVHTGKSAVIVETDGAAARRVFPDEAERAIDRLRGQIIG